MAWLVTVEADGWGIHRSRATGLWSRSLTFGPYDLMIGAGHRFGQAYCYNPHDSAWPEARRHDDRIENRARRSLDQRSRDKEPCGAGGPPRGSGAQEPGGTPGLQEHEVSI